MEKITELMRSTKRSLARSARNLMATVIRTCSDTSRMHLVVAQGDDVYDALCTLEQHDSTSLKRAMHIQQTLDFDVPVRVRELGDYSVALVVVEWPLQSSEKITPQATLRSLLELAAREERWVDGITLVADEWLIFEDLGFNACFVETFQELQRLGYDPCAIVQRCKDHETRRLGRLPFNANYLTEPFFTRLNLHRLLAKRIDSLQK